MHPASVLRELLSGGSGEPRGETLVMPDAYDPLSARIIEKLGFQAVQCSGFSIALSQCWPVEGTFGRERNVAATAAIVNAVKVPVMADGEDGFGDAGAIPDTIHAYIAAGVAGINLEDQVLGEPGPKRVLPVGMAAEKIRAARQAAIEAGVPELVINGRTDALMAGETPEQGMAEAIARANAYLQAGADLAFIIGVDSLEQVRVLVREIDGPISIAAGMPNNLGSLSVAQLRDAGVARVSLPSLMIFAAIKAMMRSLQSVADSDGFEGIIRDDLACSMGDVMGLLAP
jgi:2-methylisocitrate lyase-like PEP mutase family enzyme